MRSSECTVPMDPGQSCSKDSTATGAPRCSRDMADPNRYVTIARWETIESRAAMLTAAQDAYHQLDERVTPSSPNAETELGVFEDLQAV